MKLIYCGSRVEYIIVVVTPYMKMSLRKSYVFILFLFASRCCALNCRSERGTKEAELRRVFNNCLKQMERNNSRQSLEEWRDRDYNPRNQWESDNKNENRNSNIGNRDSGMGEKDRNRSNRGGENERYDRKQDRESMNENENHRMDDRYNTMSGKNNMNGDDTGSGRDRNVMMNSYGRNGQINGRNDFLQTEDFDGNESTRQQHNYYSSSQPPRRYKREKRLEQVMNSGQRSQYNPHSQRSSSHESSHEKRNSSDNSSKEVEKACVLHCFLENLHLTGDSGMPDRYLVTHAFTRDERNEDLRDFIQESIEECFQILDNENEEDKCEFSKNLLTCLSEKEKANCDDWSEKSSFIFE